MDEETRNPSDGDTSDETGTEEPAKTEVTKKDDATEKVSLLDAINKATGRTYQNDEEALKGIKETTKYVGKVGKYAETLQKLEKEFGGEQKLIDALNSFSSKDKSEAVKLREEIEALKEANFYSAHAEYLPYQKLISALRKDGQTLDEVVKSEEFKIAYQPTGEAPIKSVIHSNARVADNSSDYAADFETAKKTGDWNSFLKKHKGIDLAR